MKVQRHSRSGFVTEFSEALDLEGYLCHYVIQSLRTDTLLMLSLHQFITVTLFSLLLMRYRCVARPMS